MYFERHVSNFLTGFAKDDLWFPNLFFHIGSVAARYRLVNARAVTKCSLRAFPIQGTVIFVGARAVAVVSVVHG